MVKAVLALTQADEAERWRQLQHPVTHKIIMSGRADFDIRPGYVFERAGRRFHVQAIPHDLGDLGDWAVYLCVERGDVYRTLEMAENVASLP
jgi:hypothetical protein